MISLRRLSRFGSLKMPRHAVRTEAPETASGHTPSACHDVGVNGEPIMSERQ